MKAFIAILPALLTASAMAEPISFVETVTGSGSLGSNNFTDALITLTFNGNTSNVSGPTIYSLPGFLAVSVAGIPGSGVFSDSLIAVDNQIISRGGFSDQTLGVGILLMDAGAFASYDLKSAIGPISGAAFQPPLSAPFNTTAGTFTITSLTSNPTFTATTPEPVGIIPLAVSLLSLACVNRRIACGVRHR